MTQLFAWIVFLIIFPPSWLVGHIVGSIVEGLRRGFYYKLRTS